MHIFSPISASSPTASKEKHQSSFQPRGPEGRNQLSVLKVRKWAYFPPDGPFLSFGLESIKCVLSFSTESIGSKKLHQSKGDIDSDLRWLVSASQPYELVLKLHAIIYSLIFFFSSESCRDDTFTYLGVLLLFKVPYACYGWWPYKRLEY